MKEYKIKFFCIQQKIQIMYSLTNSCLQTHFFLGEIFAEVRLKAPLYYFGQAGLEGLAWSLTGGYLTNSALN